MATAKNTQEDEVTSYQTASRKRATRIRITGQLNKPTGIPVKA